VSQRPGAPNPKRHVHAGRSRDLAMITGLPHLGGGRTNPPTQPTRPTASSSNGPPTCDQPWSRVHLPRLAPRRTSAPSRRACGLLTEAPAQPPARGRMSAGATGPPAHPGPRRPRPRQGHPSRPATTSEGAPCERAVCTYRAVLGTLMDNRLVTRISKQSVRVEAMCGTHQFRMIYMLGCVKR
jgi:hypothetical protein